MSEPRPVGEVFIEWLDSLDADARERYERAGDPDD